MQWPPRRLPRRGDYRYQFIMFYLTDMGITMDDTTHNDMSSNPSSTESNDVVDVTGDDAKSAVATRRRNAVTARRRMSRHTSGLEHHPTQ